MKWYTIHKWASLLRLLLVQIKTNLTCSQDAAAAAAAHFNLLS